MTTYKVAFRLLDFAILSTHSGGGPLLSNWKSVINFPCLQCGQIPLKLLCATFSLTRVLPI